MPTALSPEMKRRANGCDMRVVFDEATIARRVHELGEEITAAELNAEIEHASPHGKDKGEKVPGQKRKIGAAAAREYALRHR